MTKEDFLTNHKFIRWVNNPDRELDTYWKNWMDANPEHLPNLKVARELLLRIQFKELEARAGAKQRILDNILRSQQPAPIKPFIRKVKYPEPKADIWDKVSHFQRIAAILLFSFSLVWLTFPYKEPEPLETLVEEISKIQKITAPGEKLQVTLPDGTRVWLNAVSKLEFPERFDSLERWVSLSGEGFFEVEKDSLRPFRVVTNGMVTTALGTSFNINSKSGDKVMVSLLTGKVKVKATSVSEDVFLDPGQELRYDKDHEKISINGFNSEEVIAWRDGQIIFKDASLSEVVKILEDWYGVNIHMENPKGIVWKYSGEYRHQTLENVLNSLAYIQKFRYTINEKNVEFKF
jgi:ferric-dicitrate binding protein FerR (iron transport regulator)